jgi:predicted GIY-YIG superfamily endonuclease
MFVYLIRSSENSHYKIGHTKDINSRIKQLQTGNSDKIYLVDSYKSEFSIKIENALHNFYVNKKILNEWFDFGIEEEVNFRKMCIKIENNLKYIEINKI